MNTNFLKLLVGASLITSLAIIPLNATQNNKQSKPFLIQKKLPHLSMGVKMMWDDSDVAFTKQQKEKLLKIRKNTLSSVKKLNKKIIALENKVVKLSKDGVNPSEIQKYVYEIASYRAEATMIHLKCIYETKKILTKDQLEIVE